LNSTFRVGLIRVVTLRDKELLNAHALMIQKILPELKVESRCIEDQPEGIYNDETEKKAVPKIIRLAKDFEKEGFDAVIISCAADPGVEELRKQLKIPVIGAGSAAASLALAYGKRIGVLNLTRETPRVISEILGPHLVAEESPRDVKNTLDLFTERGLKNALEALEKLLRKDIDVILLGCTGYSTIGLADYAKKINSKPIIDPVIASGFVTYSLLKMKRGE